jgi:hypothetical protein
LSLKEKTVDLSKHNQELKYEIEERKRAEEQLEQRTKLYRHFLTFPIWYLSTLDIKPLLEAILDKLKIIIDYKGAKKFILEGEVLRVVAYEAKCPNAKKDKYSFSIRQSFRPRYNNGQKSDCYI